MMSQSNTSNLKGRKVILHDMCLRDGMHAKREQISVDQMVKVATALDAAGVPYLQVTHGAGLGATRCSTALRPTATRNTSPPWPRR
jgi:4-hydroxy-2-oxovalerate/4-hydroxy-2-oxohexanoate aldolase